MKAPAGVFFFLHKLTAALFYAKTRQCPAPICGQAAETLIIFFPYSMHFSSVYAVTKFAFCSAAHTRENCLESYNTVHYIKCPQRSPAHFIVTQLTKGCPN